jgi:DNA polymerase-3 subunit delta'
VGFAAIAAQDQPLALLRRALARDRLGQAYLFVGPAGVGKQLTALALARAALCEAASSAGEGGLVRDACERCESCRRIREGVHPDVRVFAPRDEGKRNLPVDFVRSEVLPFAKFAPFEADRAFVIFPEADVSFPIEHPEAANALLKTLEEPRSRVCFVLTSERPDRLLSTIRSRCQRVRFARLPTETVERLLRERGVDEATARTAAGLSGGRMDRGLLLCDGERARALLETALQIDGLLADGRTAALLEVADGLAKSEQRALVLETLRAFYRDVAAAGLGLPAEALAFAHERARIAEVAARVRPVEAALRVQALLAFDEQLAGNANPELALDGLLLAASAR